MISPIGAAGRAASQIADSLLSRIEQSGRADWPALTTALAPSGRHLDESVRQRMEPLVGSDLGDVRVHSGSEVRSLAQHLGADAFTIGRHAFVPGVEVGGLTGRPGGLLAHELTHAVQQSGSRGPVAPSRFGHGDLSSPISAQRSVDERSPGTLAAEVEARGVEVAARQGSGQVGEERKIDVEVLTQKVYELMRRDIAIDRERLGPRW